MKDVESNKSLIKKALNQCYDSALNIFNKNEYFTVTLNATAIDMIHDLANQSEAYSTAYSNIITGAAIKLAYPKFDVRYHQTGIQIATFGESWFNHRGISETVVCPWMSSKDFDGAKSGWQTRTFERPKPYMSPYEEKIQGVKTSFLGIYDLLEQTNADGVEEILTYFLFLQSIKREAKQINLATPNIDDIAKIMEHLKDHINYSYQGKGGSRLPVLALYAIFSLVSEQVSRYKNINILALNSHSAADSQTGSAGDIEFLKEDSKLIEAIEVKHQIVITTEFVADTEIKIAPFQLNRYYILTTHNNCKPSDEIASQLARIKTRLGCQIIVNGVFPTIQYYLRLVEDPSAIYHRYCDLLYNDSDVTHEHRQVWNKLILGD